MTQEFESLHSYHLGKETHCGSDISQARLASASNVQRVHLSQPTELVCALHSSLTEFWLPLGMFGFLKMDDQQVTQPETKQTPDDETESEETESTDSESGETS